MGITINQMGLDIYKVENEQHDLHVFFSETKNETEGKINYLWNTLD